MLLKLWLALLLIIIPLGKCTSFTAFQIAGSRKNAFAPPSLQTSVSRFSTKNSQDEEQYTESDESCPFRKFTMNYARFRVPVSSQKDKPNYTAKKGIFSGIQAAMDKSTVERKYSSGNGTRTKHQFHWIEPYLDTSKDDNRIAKAKVGIFTSSIVWEMAARIQKECLEAQDEQTRKSVVSIPRASWAGLFQLADIINWYNDESSVVGIPVSVNIHATVDEEMPVPTIILEATRKKDVDPSTSMNQLSSAQIIQGTQSWVKRVLVQLGICPFTKSVTKSGQGLADVGVPVGRIAYHCSHAKSDEIPLLMADTWRAILEMTDKGPSGKEGISSILLSAPEFDHNFPLWAGPIFAILEANVSAASAEPLIGIVCFHPQYKTPDGKSWPGFGQMHSLPRLRKWLKEEDEGLSSRLEDEQVAAGGAYQRRTPFATINVLRAEQLEAAEGRRSTSSLYANNIRVLNEYGYERLEEEMCQDKM